MIKKEKRLKDFQICLDLIVEILKKLPSKSLMRFRCVSKQWSTIISNRRDFIESIMARSLATPSQQLPIFIFHHCVPEPFFTFSSTFSQRTKPKISIPYVPKYQYVRGLICCSVLDSPLVIIYNPTTRQYIPLPEISSLDVRSESSYCCHFGYDHVMNQYKVLSIIIDEKELAQTFHVFTLESPIKCQSWRKIQCNIDQTLFPSVNKEWVCIDGTIYYLATRRRKFRKDDETVLLSFNIRSERFDHVWAPETILKALSSALYHQFSYRTLVNYQGKLGCICCNMGDISMYIMGYAGKQEWSKVSFLSPIHPSMSSFRILGATPAGEIFMIKWWYTFNMSPYVYYYDIKKNSLRGVEIEGTSPEKIRKEREWIHVYAIHDHVENTMWL